MKKVILILIFLFSANILFSQSVYQIDNLDFEKGVLGGEPFPWRFPKSVLKYGYSGYLTDSIAYSGRYSFIMTNPNRNFDTIPEGDPNECTVYQNVDPKYYLNKKVRFKIFAMLENDLSKTRAEMWIISKDNNDKVNLSYFDTINVIKSNKWKEYSIEAKVPSDSKELRFGVLLVGGGSLIVDNASFDIVNPDSYKPKLSTQLNDDSRTNINSLAKIYTAMRYFLPSDKANNTEWEYYLESYLDKNLDSASSINFLENFISPYKDAVYISGAINKFDNKIDNYVPNQISYAMFYRGVPNPLMNESGDDFRRNIYSVTRRREGSISFMTDLIKYGGKELRISADMKVNKESPVANAQLWARADIVNSREFVTKTTANDPVSVNEWQKKTIYMDLPENVYRVKLALVFLGEGSANYDNIKLEIYDNGKLIKKIDDYNLDFELPSSLNQIRDWEIESAVIGAGYNFDIDNTTSSKGKKSLVIKSDNNRVVYPEEGSYLSFFLPKDKFFNINVCALTQNGKTLPIENDKRIISEPDSIFRTWEDINSRIAALIQMYALVSNFGANEVSPDDLDSSFNYNLERLSNQLSFDEYLSIYHNFLLVAKDSRARVWNSFVSDDYAIPLLFKKIDIRHIVVQSYDEELPISIGDEILKIDNIDIEEYISSISHDFYSSNDNYKFAKAGAVARAGKKDSEVVLTIKTPNNAVQDVVVKRTKLLNEIFEPRPKAIQQFNDSTLYVDMTEITDNNFKEILNRIDIYKYFIFDMRGESVMSEHLLSLFADTILPSYNWIVPFYTHPFKKNSTREVFVGLINPKNKLQNKKLYFLINERSAGYSDFIARIIKKNKFGTLVGTETQGNPSELVSTKLSGGFSLALSSILSIDDNNRVILDNPIKPDVIVEDNINDILNNKDSYIEKVLELISK